MASTTNFSVRMDSDIKKMRQSLRMGGFPFDVRPEQPNREAVAAMLEAEHIVHGPDVKHYSDVEEALQELKK